MCVIASPSLREHVGKGQETVDVDPSLDLNGLWELLVRRHPVLSGFPRPLAACDREYASWDHRLEGVRREAFLPPVSGG